MKAGRFGAVGLLAFAAGCPMAPPPPPDLPAIATVVNHVYRTQGFERPVLFLDTGEVCDSILPRCVPSDGGISPALKTQLETDLQVKVRSLSEADLTHPCVPALTPVLPETGEVGVSVSLGRFREEDDSYWHVNVSIARSGLESMIVDYVLERDDAGWTIIEPNLTLQDDMGLHGAAEFATTRALLGCAIGDLAAIYNICENIPQDRSASRCWTKASQLNPELRDQICDHMLEYVDYPYEEECRLGVVWPLER